MKIINLRYKDINKLIKFLKPFNNRKLNLNPNYLKKKFFLNFFNIDKLKKSKCLILLRNNKIIGFRGNVDKKFQYSSNKKIKVPNLGDHRICMSAFILAILTGAKVIIKNFETVYTSSPSFLKIMKLLGAKFEVTK